MEDPPNSARGFTLIELLAVVAIVAILAAILFPIFRSAKIAAKTAGCLSNLRQIGNAFALYHQIYEGRFPYGIDAADYTYTYAWSFETDIPDARQQVEALKARPNRGGWLDVVLRPLAPNPELWHCPADTGSNFVATWIYGGSSDGQSCFERLHMSYGYRTGLALMKKPVQLLVDPARTNVLADFAGYWHSRFARPPKSRDDTADLEQWSYNVLFADNHVRNLTNQQYYAVWSVRYKDLWQDRRN